MPKFKWQLMYMQIGYAVRLCPGYKRQCKNDTPVDGNIHVHVEMLTQGNIYRLMKFLRRVINN